MSDGQKTNPPPFAWGFIGLLIGTIIPLVVLHIGKADAVVSIPMSLGFGFLSLVVCYMIPFLRDMKVDIDDRFQDLAKHAALGVPQERFRDWLDCIADNKGSHRWIIAKYISRKLDMDFPTVKGTRLKFADSDGVRISTLFANLIREARKYIYLTFPYQPKQYFSTFYRSVCNNCDGTSCILGTRKMPNDVRKRWPPAHIKAISNRKNIDVIRIVTVPWDKNNGQEECLKTLEKISKSAGIDTKHFDGTSRKEVKALVEDINNKLLDVNIFDGLVVIWDRFKGECELILSQTETDMYGSLFHEEVKILSTGNDLIKDEQTSHELGGG